MRTLKSGFLLSVALLVAGLTAFYLLFPAEVARLGRAAERSAAGLQQHTLELPTMQIQYLEGGAGDPLLLIHGFGADKDHWTRVARHLTPHFRVIAIDLPGFGESSKPDAWRYRIQDQVERVHAIAQALELRRPHLGGSSMGGNIAASYAARYPTEVASLWLVAPGGVVTAEPSEMMQRVDAGEPVPLLARTPAEFESILEFVFADPPYLPSAFRKTLAARAADNYRLHSRIFVEIRQESIPLENLVNGLGTPTRVLWGEQDRVLHVSGAQVLARLMPNASVTLMPGVGHLPMIERPKASAEDYLAFRRSL
jgi:abhydrolase domain-containing protein 6